MEPLRRGSKEVVEGVVGGVGDVVEGTKEVVGGVVHPLVEGTKDVVGGNPLPSNPTPTPNPAPNPILLTLQESWRGPRTWWRC